MRINKKLFLEGLSLLVLAVLHFAMSHINLEGDFEVFRAAPGNYYGNLYVAETGGKFYRSIDNHNGFNRYEISEETYKQIKKQIEIDTDFWGD